jgi:glycerol-3-phosphate acyltransferase PlsY
VAAKTSTATMASRTGDAVLADAGVAAAVAAATDAGVAAVVVVVATLVAFTAVVATTTTWQLFLAMFTTISSRALATPMAAAPMLSAVHAPTWILISAVHPTPALCAATHVVVSRAHLNRGLQLGHKYIASVRAC